MICCVKDFIDIFRSCGKKFELHERWGLPWANLATLHIRSSYIFVYPPIRVLRKRSSYAKTYTIISEGNIIATWFKIYRRTHRLHFCWWNTQWCSMRMKPSPLCLYSVQIWLKRKFRLSQAYVWSPSNHVEISLLFYRDIRKIFSPWRIWHYGCSHDVPYNRQYHCSRTLLVSGLLVSDRVSFRSSFIII